MWLPWPKSPARNRLSNNQRTTHIDTELSRSISFKDIHQLLYDNKTSPTSTSTSTATATAITKTPSILHRARRLRSLCLHDPNPDPNIPPGIVLFYTSLRVVRSTFEACWAVRSILQGLRVKIDDRDVTMHLGFMTELQGIMGTKNVSLPRVFINGKYIGGAEEIKQMNETGELKKLVEELPKVDGEECESCGGFRFVLCDACNGSRKVFVEKAKGFRSCWKCNENGLIRCPIC